MLKKAKSKKKKSITSTPGMGPVRRRHAYVNTEDTFNPLGAPKKLKTKPTHGYKIPKTPKNSGLGWGH